MIHLAGCSAFLDSVLRQLAWCVHEHIEERGVKLLLLDFCRMTDNADILALIERTRTFFPTQPKRKEILTPADVTSTRLDNAVLNAFENLIRQDEPWEPRQRVHRRLRHALHDLDSFVRD